MTHTTDVDGLPDQRPASPGHPRRILHDRTAHAAALASRKPSNWWAFEREPWKRVNAEIMAGEKADADRERADRALKSAFAFAGAAPANVPSLMANAPSLVPEDRE